MTPEQRQARFLQDIQRVLDKHKAEILVTDDRKDYGMHSGVAHVTLDSDGDLPFTEFDLPGFMVAARAADSAGGKP